MSEKLLTVAELATVLNTSKFTIYRMVRDNLIPYDDLRGGYRFSLNEVLTTLQSKSHATRD